MNTEDDRREWWERYWRWRLLGGWRRIMGPCALACGLGCWVISAAAQDAFGIAGLVSMAGVTCGSFGLGIPERRAQSIAGFVLAVVFFLYWLVVIAARERLGEAF